MASDRFTCVVHSASAALALFGTTVVCEMAAVCEAHVRWAPPSTQITIDVHGHHASARRWRAGWDAGTTARYSGSAKAMT